MPEAVRSRFLAAPLAAILLFAATFLSSCSDEPNATGIGLIPDSLHIGTIVVTANADTSVRVRLGGNGATILVGKSGTYEARSIMEFNLGSYDSTAAIDSAVVTLRLRYAFPATSGDLGFEVHAMARTWAASTITWDSLAGSTDAAVAGTFLAALAPGDSVVSFRLDTTLVRTWWKAGNVSLQLVPSPGSSIVVGFGNTFTTTEDSRAAFVLNYHTGSTDSLTLSPKASRVLFVATDDLQTTPTGLTLQAGVARRGLIRFDSLAVPPLASITSAVLELTVDTLASITNAYTRDSIYVHLLRKNIAPWDSLALQLLCTPVTEGGQKYYRADVRSLVQQWVSREPNLGVLVRAYGDFSTLDKIVLHDGSAPLALQPKIRITYTLLPQ